MVKGGQMSIYKKLQNLNLTEDSMISLRYSEGADVFVHNETEVDTAMSETDVINRFSELVATPGLRAQTKWGDHIIQELRDSGLVTIGGHSWSHEYFVNMKINEVKKDIEISHKNYLKELKFIPDLYAHTFGETSSDLIELIKKFKYKIIFGQHSGVISQNENIYYLPRFSLNENYGKPKRFKNILRSRAFNLKSYEPKTILLDQSNNPTNLKLTFNENVKGINCFDNSGGSWRNTKINFVSSSKVELIFELPFKKRRGRINCTMPAADGLIKWFGYQYSVVN